MEETITNWPYNGYNDLVCSICRKQTKTSDCELLEGTVLEVLEVVLINLNLTTIQPVICNDCKKKLLDAFQHKSTWIYTEDRLFPYINSAIDGKVDIKTVYVSEKDCKPSDVETDIQICRMCMELINDKSWNMLADILEKQYSLEIFEKYVPELNLRATENPIICKRCVDSLRFFMGFVTFYQDQEVKTEDYFEVKEESKPGGINPASIEDMELMKMEYASKCQDILKCTLASTDKGYQLKHEAEQQAKQLDCKIYSYSSSFKDYVEKQLLEKRHRAVSKLKEPEIFQCALCSYHTKDKAYFQSHILIHQPLFKVFKCEFCSFETKYKSSLQRHILIHKPLSEVQVFNCEFCIFQTKHKGSLHNHVLIHKACSELEMFKCELCAFQTKLKANLQHHILIHKPLSEVEMFKCEFCSFEAKRKGNLRQHILTHKRFSEISDVDMFKCEVCSFETKRKRNLRNHILIHKPLSEVEAFKCEFCTFETKHKRGLQNHVLIHQPFSEVEIFKCEICMFVTKRKRSLLNHILIHKPLSEVEVFKCELCSFETNRKINMRRHILIHKPLSEVEVFKCEFCTYKTKHKRGLQRHILIHKPLSNVEVFNCDFCYFQTKYKSSLINHIQTHKSF